ncbi:MAG: hypothetical protein RLZZ84_2017 [Pseudomonadota bacterium]|jgi:hypothetical protein
MSAAKEIALDAMLDAIRAVTRDVEHPTLGREGIIDILEVVAEHLDPLLQETVLQDQDFEVAVEHAAVAQIRGLASALRDLDTGLTDPIFKPYEHGANATLPWCTRASDAALVEMLRVYQKKFKLTQKAAAKKLAVDLTANGYLRKGNALTGRSLQRLKYGATKRGMNSE